jgi:hypothetical protein
MHLVTITIECLKISIFWDIMRRSPLKVNRRFGGTCRLHFQGRRISRARNQCESRWQAELLLPFRWKLYVPLKRRLTFNGLHGVISQKIEPFITTGVRTSNPTYWLLIRIFSIPKMTHICEDRFRLERNLFLNSFRSFFIITWYRTDTLRPYTFKFLYLQQKTIYKSHSFHRYFITDEKNVAGNTMYE